MYTYKTLIRDFLVDNATFRGLFNAAATGSCRVNMDNLFVSAVYPQVLIGYGAGETRSNLNADSAQIFLTIEAKGTSTTHAYKELGNFRSAIMDIIDDTSLQSNTAVAYHCRKFSEVEGFDEDKKIRWHRLGFDVEYLQNFNLP